MTYRFSTSRASFAQTRPEARFYGARSVARLIALVMALGVLLFGAGAWAQRTRQVLQHQVRSAVTSHNAPLVNHLSVDTQMNFSIVLPLRNDGELTSFLGRLYDPSSPDYRKFLSVDQFTQRFGPTQDDYDAVVAFAQKNGFTITGTPANRLVVPVSGTADQVNAAFNVQMNVYQHPTEKRTFFSPDREPSLDLAVPVARISGLDDFSLPQRFSKHAQENQQPLAVTGSGPGGSYLASDMRAAYYGGSVLTGANQAVGILEFGGYQLSDVNLTFSNAGQSYSVPVNNVLLDGATGAPIGSDAEEVLDIVQAIGMAPGLSQVRVYIGSGSDDANILNSMASENIAKQLSCSWGWRPADPQAADVFFREMAAQGQSFFTSSGDAGAFDATINPFFFPAEDEYVTAVGGTHLTTNGAGGAWASESAWNSQGYGTGGGISPDGIALPSWQSGIANSANAGSTTLRNVPDVAMEGDFDNYLCALGSCSGTGAGTSFSAPRWAGFMALVNQQAVEAGNAPTGGIGFINPQLYLLAEGSRSSSDFHDVVTGNNKTSTQSIWYSAVPGYDLTTGWGSPTGQNLIDDLAGPQVPGFFLNASQGIVTINPGGSASVKVTVSDAGGFTGNVNFAVTSTLPSGVTASFSPNPSADSTVLTLTSTSTTPQGDVPVTVTGTSGSLSATTSFTLGVHAPTFALTASPSALSINQGASGSTSVIVVPEYGFSDMVNLVASGLPTGVTATFSPSATSGSSVLTLAVSSTATPGKSTITIAGASGSIAASTTITLTINGPSFALTAASSVSAGQGASASTTVTISDLYGFTGNVNLAVSGLPSGVTASFSPNPAATSSILTFQVNSAAAVGQSTITITGTSGAVTASTKLALVISTPSFTLSTSGTANIGQGAQANTFVYTSSQNGFTGAVNLSVAGLPSGVTALWNPNPVTNSGTSTLTLIVGSTAKIGQYPLIITGTSGTLTATTNLTLNVYAPTFTLGGSSSVSLGQGATASASVYVTPQYGFTGSVNLSISGLPSGVTGSFSPNPASSNSVLTLQASSSAATGQYTATITGTYGSQTVTMPLTVAVYTPTFTLSSGSVTLGRGAAASNAYVYVTSLYGFNGSVNLSVSGLPSGVTASFSTNPATSSSTLSLAASTSAPLGQFTATITGTSGTQTATTNLSIGIFDPSFTLGGGTAFTLGQGTSGTGYYYVTSQYGFSSAVSFSIAGLPAGVTASFSPNPTTYNTTLTLNAAASVPVGQYNLTITGTSGSLSSTLPITLNVYAPTFTLTAYSGASVGQGGTGTGTVYINTQYGFSSGVNLSVSGLPSGVTATFSPNPATSYSTITFAATSTAATGASTLTITGTSGTQTVTTTTVLNVYPPSFSLSSSYSGSVNVGASANANVYVNNAYGFTGSVTLAVSGLPNGVTATLSPNPTTGTSTVTFAASSAAVPGTYNVTFTGTSGALTASTAFQLTINSPGFTLTAVPAKVNLAPGRAVPATILLTPSNGFAASATLSVSGLPNGVTAGFSPATITSSSVLTLTAGSTVTPGSYTLVVTGTTSSTGASTALSLVVSPNALAATGTTMALTAGGSAVTSISAGTAITAIATVAAGASSVTAGQVNLCETTAPVCDALHSVGTAQLTNAGTAVLHFVPAAGNHSYQAAFAGTAANAASSSAATLLTVTGSLSSTTSIAQSGTVGNYSLMGTVAGRGPLPPSGNLSFLDTSNGNAVLAQAPLVSNSAALTLGASRSQATGSQPNAAVTGDFNGDGIPDLVVSNASSSTLTIFLGKGDGTFNTSSLALGYAPASVAIGDFNHDGIPDLVVPYSGNSVMGVFLGNGDGTFRAGTGATTSSSYYASAAVGDFNGDGVQDVALVSSFYGTLTILLGNGDGTFVPLTPISLASAYQVVAGDFNGDGVTDLAVSASYTAKLTILLGNGDGTFTVLTSTSLAGYGGAITVADFNQDGKADLVVASTNSSPATLLMGKGDGTFTVSTVSALGNAVGNVTVADFNHDGKPDLAAIASATTLAVATGNGDGTFTSATSVASGSSPVAVLAADWNGDGIVDLATVNAGNSTVAFLTSALAQTSTATAKASPLGSGQHAVLASFPGDATYNASVSAATNLTAAAGKPAVSLSLSASSITTLQTLTVTVSVSGGAGNPAPTGTITLGSGSYTSAAAMLSNGSVMITVPAGSLPVGNNPLSASYAPDPSSSSIYTASTGTGSVAVASVTPTVTLSLSAANITAVQPLTVTVKVDSGVTGAVPTGSVVLTSGSYTSAAVLLSNGTGSITIPGGSLVLGNDTLTAAYTPDTAGAATFSAATGSGSVVVGKLTPAVTLSLSGSSITTTQPLSVTVAVDSGVSGAVPTGSVLLVSESYSSTAVALSGGRASIVIPAGSLAPGNDALSVTYTPDASGAGTYNAAMGSGSVAVGKTTPALTLSLSAASVTTLQSLTVTLGVSAGPGAVVPTGTVTLTSGSYTSAATALNNGGAVITVPAGALASGTDVLSALYTPDTSGAGVYNTASGSASVAVGKAIPSISLNLSASSITTVQSLVVTLGVAGGTGTAAPTGSFTLTSGSYTSAATPTSSGSAVITIPAGALPAGNNTLTASFTPDASGAALYISTSSTASVNVSKVPPTLSLSLSATAITTLQPLTVTVGLSGGASASSPSGDVILTSGSYSSASTPVVNGSASITVPAGSLIPGNDALSISYTPDAPGAAVYSSTSNSSSVAVSKVTPTLALNLSAASIATTQPLTVTISASSGAGATPTGTVTLSSGSYASAVVALKNGSASVTVAAGSLPAGADVLAVSYSPDAAGTATYNAAAGTASVSVTKTLPTVAVSLSSASITTAQTLTATVGVSGGAGTTAPTGSITLTSGSFTSSAAALVNGSVTITVPAGVLAVGNDVLQATYTPDAAGSAIYSGGYGSANVAVAVAIGFTTPTVTLTPSPATLTNQMSDAVSVLVTGVSGQPTPTGSVTLSSGSYSVQASLSGGTVSFTIPAGALAAGANTLTAAYSGDSVYAARTNTASVTVVPVVMSTSTVSSIVAGGSASSTVTLSAGSSYTGTMNVTCSLTASPSGAQSLPACRVSPTSVTLTAGGTAATILTVSTTAASHAALETPSGIKTRGYLLGGPLAAGLLFFLLPVRRRRFAALVVLLGALAAGISGCAGGGNGGNQSTQLGISATTSGTYTFTVTATDGAANVSATSNVTVTVQ